MKMTIPARHFRRNAMSIIRNAGLCMLGAFLAGCPASNTNQTTAPVAAKPSGKIVIRGSNTVGEELAPQLITGFKKDHPSADFDLETKATGYGLAALRAGLCDIAAASRPANKEEVAEAKKMGVEMNDYVIGAYSVAVVVNSANPVKDLTPAQVKDIFTGKVQNWKDVGGPDAPIHLYVRDPISGTYLGFRELAMDNQPYAAEPTLGTNYEAILVSVGKDANGIGYSSIDLPKEAAVKSVSIGGTPATAATINQGKYPYSRVLHLYTNKGKEAAGAHDFVDFVMNAKGQALLAQAGFVPHP